MAYAHWTSVVMPKRSNLGFNSMALAKNWTQVMLRLESRDLCHAKGIALFTKCGNDLGTARCTSHTR